MKNQARTIIGESGVSLLQIIQASQNGRYGETTNTPAIVQSSVPKTGANIDESKTATQNMGKSIKELNTLYKMLDKRVAP